MVFLSACGQENKILIDVDYQEGAQEKLAVSGERFGNFSLKPAESLKIDLLITNRGNDKVRLSSILEKGKSASCKDFFMAVDTQASTCVAGLSLDSDETCTYRLIIRPDSQFKLFYKDFVVSYFDNKNIPQQEEFNLTGSLKVELPTNLLGNIK